jgi:ribosomal-protein-alanine N-acetyltransferase
MKFPESPVIETKRLILRLVQKADLPALFAVSGDDEAVRYTPQETWKTPADGEAWFSRVTENHAKGAALQFVITLREGGFPIGTKVLFHFNEPAKCAEVGYMLARAYWGQGLTTEALRAFVDFSFQTFGLDRLEARTDPRNVASGKALERVGFAKEGHQRRNFFAKGEISDTGLYGMLREEWRPGK